MITRHLRAKSGNQDEDTVYHVDHDKGLVFVEQANGTLRFASSNIASVIGLPEVEEEAQFLAILNPPKDENDVPVEKKPLVMKAPVEKKAPEAGLASLGKSALKAKADPQPKLL